MKKALVNPLIKKTSLDPSDYKKYRPVFNHESLSKALERAMADQLKSYISANNLVAELQSAYRAKHSTKTAPLRLVSDTHLATD